jgi:PPM family protein phosphatase
LKIEDYKLNIGNATDTGQVREYNEDYLAHFPTAYGYCIVVCDGMGGHAAGDVASQSTVEALKHYLQDGSLTKLDTPNSLLNAIEFANFKLREMVAQSPELKGMGTTCVLALINDDELFIAYAGDSRLYLLRKNEIRLLTKDHSVIQQMIDAGTITEEESHNSEKRNQITKAIGIFDKAEPTVTTKPYHLKYGDKILICSDGLTGHLDSKEINEIAKSSTDVQLAASKLVEMANIKGGTDNITVQIVEYKGRPKNASAIRKRKFLFIILLLTALAIAGTAVFMKLRPGNPPNPVPVTDTLKKVEADNKLPNSFSDSAKKLNLVIKPEAGKPGPKEKKSNRKNETPGH